MSLDYWQYFVESFKDPKTVISLASATFSFISLFFTRRFWLATNRPIISASIVSNEPGNIATRYNLVVYNTGNRPATSIRLFAEQAALDNIIDSGADQIFIDNIHKCFSIEAIIPLLINGKEASNYFGMSSGKTGDNDIKYNSELPIQIFYSDLENRSYMSKQVLKVKNSQGFAGMRCK